MKKKQQTKDAVTVVAAVQEQAEMAAALARISGQDRLTDARLNPATRPHADELRDEQQTKALDAGHARELRRLRVLDARAADAERTLEAIALARAAANPARSVLALHRGRRAWSRLALGASAVLAAGSAMGVEAAAHAMHAPRGTGYVAEVGLTGLSTAAIAYRAHLAEHRGTLVRDSWQARALWVLMTVPLLISVAANLARLNALGAACSIGAGAFALLGAVVADRSAAAMQDRAAEVDTAEVDELRAVATGDDLFAAVPDAPEDAPAEVPALGGGDGCGTTGVPQSRTDADTDAGGLVDELAAWLAAQSDDGGDPDDGQDDGGDGSARPTSPVPSGGPSGAARPVPLDAGAGHIVGRIDAGAGHIEPDQRRDRPDPDRVAAAAEARRAAGEETRQRVAAFLADHPEASNSAAAAALGTSTATVKRARRALRTGGLTVSPPVRGAEPAGGAR